jgi:hypothetical protein
MDSTTGMMFTSTLMAYLFQSPVLLVWLAGMVIAVVTWRRHPRVSLLTVVALVILLVETLIDTFLSMWLAFILSESQMGAAQIGWVTAVVRVVAAVVAAIAWGITLAAIFGGRKPPAEGAMLS